MPRKKSNRRFLLTINNPADHGYTHDRIKAILSECAEQVYWCMCDEMGEQGTYHTHLFIVFKNSVMFDTLHGRFYGAHIDPAAGTNAALRDYVRKEGKWLDDAKHETNLPETFEEWGELPPDRSRREMQSEQIMNIVRAGKSDAEILDEIPGALTKLHHIEKARQALLEAKHKDEWRNLEVTYIWGETGVGKTRSVMEKYGYSNVCRVTNYEHPFDDYKGQDVIIFEEFRSSLKIEDMLKYLDGYPLQLPCRYSDKTACYTKVFIISNLPLEYQFTATQQGDPATWGAFRRRIHTVQHMARDFTDLTDEPGFDPDSIFGDPEAQ